jgi:RND superfamily putative drug exporter
VSDFGPGRTVDNVEAVARGLSVTSRVITAAAGIMIAVFRSFAVSDQRIVKEFGMGLAVAIFLDATWCAVYSSYR